LIGLFPTGFPTKTLYTSLSSPMRDTCSAHLIILDLICLMISGDKLANFLSSLYLYNKSNNSNNNNTFDITALWTCEWGLEEIF
jgi:hypothetical protein